MNILFDHQTFVYQRFGGISRYFVELASHCNKIKEVSAEISVVLSDNVYLPEFSGNSALTLNKGNFPGSMTLYNTVNRFATIFKLFQKKQDVFHPTYYDTYFLKVLGNRPFVLTVYDMIHELYPGKWKNQEQIAYNKSVLIKKASHIIAISEHTKTDLLRFYPEIPSSKISVIWLCNSNIKEILPVKNIPEVEGNYLLFVGKRGEYKNFNYLLNTIGSFLKSYPDFRLIAAGGGPSNQEERILIEKLELEKAVKIIPFVKDSEMSALYQKAAAFIFPSSYEGFGIPILEAFEANCPVILNNASCFPEIADKAALYFEESQPSSLLNALNTILFDVGKRAELASAGKERLKFFGWDETTKKTLEVYKMVKEQHGR